MFISQSSHNLYAISETQQWKYLETLPFHFTVLVSFVVITKTTKFQPELVLQLLNKRISSKICGKWEKIHFNAILYDTQPRRKSMPWRNSVENIRLVGSRCSKCWSLIFQSSLFYFCIVSLSHALLSLRRLLTLLMHFSLELHSECIESCPKKATWFQLETYQWAITIKLITSSMLFCYWNWKCNEWNCHIPVYFL